MAEKAVSELAAKVSELEGVIAQRGAEASSSSPASEEELTALRQERDALKSELSAAREKLAKKEYQVNILIRALEEEEGKGSAATGVNAPFVTDLPLNELTDRVNAEFLSIARKFNADADYPALQLNDGHLDRGDFACNLKGMCSKMGIKDANTFTSELAQLINDSVTPDTYLARAETNGAFLNVSIKRVPVFKAAIERVIQMGEAYGTSKTMAGKKVIIEHTSSNPNGPLHIGNLRNSILGAHLAELFKAVGYEVRQHFFVNDLGAQIGLTAYGYVRVGHMEPKLKNDQWIGLIYAIMNTFNEFQKLGQNLGEVADRLAAGTLQELVDAAAEKDKSAVADYVEVISDLKGRQPELVDALFDACKGVENVRAEAGRLNLAYEQNDPEAVKIFRKMVVDCLVGVQETLDRYNVKHDSFDFESELGWEGSNDRVLDLLRNSPYYVPQTQSNAQGKPEGGHFLMAKFIEAAGLPVGKKGYQKNYPNFYFVRPDGSTLYTLRDVVYTLKKTSQADLVFNIIASEQNLPQEKVALAVQMLQPGEPQKQFHLSYELVTLDRKMSGRRARYVLADDVAEELREAVDQLMREKYKEQETEEEFFAEVSRELSTATMKHVLLNTGTRHKIKIIVDKVIDPTNSATASFLLYNFARTCSVMRNHEQMVAAGEYPPLTPIDAVDWTLLEHPIEWELLVLVLMFPSLLVDIACPRLPSPPNLPEFQTQRLCEFLSRIVGLFSKKLWSRVRILADKDKPEDFPVMNTRLYLVKAIHAVMENGIRILTMKPLERI